MTTATPTAARFDPPSEAGLSTIKPILRKRPRSSDDDDDNEPRLLSSPTKKRKTVMFNESLNMVKDISAIGLKTVEEAKRDIMTALDGHGRGDDEDYDGLKEIFDPSPAGFDETAPGEGTPPNELIVYVIALAALVPTLGRKCSGLIKSVLRCRWLERDDTFARAYIQLLAAMSSVKGPFFNRVLSMIVEKFAEGSRERGNEAQAVPGFEKVDDETKRERLHLALGYLLDLFPNGNESLVKLLKAKFPFTDESKAVHMEYIDHLLRLGKKRPELERDVMELILEQLVKLDIEMTLDLENDDDQTTRAVMRQLEISDADGDGADDESDAASIISEADDDEERAMRVALIMSKLRTMDAMMDLMFSVYAPIFEDPDSPKALETFQDLLSDFCNVILPHLKSRHTQYLLFRFAMKSRQLMELFTGTLFNIARDPKQTALTKQSAIWYLASFTARGAQVSSELVQTICKTFCDYMDSYRESYKECRGPDVRRYPVYYAYFQGLVYIFCFRWQDLIDREQLHPSLDWDDPASFFGHDLPFMPWLQPRLQENIRSRLNPLKCCSPPIVDEFAKLSFHLRLLYIYPKIEMNRKIQLSQFFGGTYATGGGIRDSGFEIDLDRGHLEPSFPFDPYQLPLSKRWLDLDKTYISWKPYAILNKPEEGDEEEEDRLTAGIRDTEDEEEEDEEDNESVVNGLGDTTEDEGGDH
ncbi:RNA polymerase I-specific transcription initiation factor RRN3 [Echria macrotheca]|uniref:RNA polymerase I-specific transcription initiation factor RRN3 n=1 Tax=Echria macrotheca TaxID=438768 RepID=A0AAJ0B6G2_9PEZI|nr:RNA polymerase I-specific transcription initiation factor RRN3 [Echria macrotheca]